MSKIRVILLCFALLTPLIFFEVNLKETLAADTEAPVIHSIAFNASTAGPGDIVLLQVNITDDDSGIEQSFAKLYNPNYESVETIGLSFNVATDFYEGTFEINQYWIPGTYYLEYIYARDVAQNIREDHHPEDFTSPTVLVSGTTPDSTPPVLHSINFDRENATSGETVYVIANITDDLSGIQSADATVSNPAGEIVVGYKLFDYNISSGFWEFSFVVNQYWIPGDYYVEHFVCGDNADNWMNGFNGTLFPTPYLEIYGTTPDYSPPEIISVEFDKKFVHTDGFVKISINASDDVSGIDDITPFVQNLDYTIYGASSMTYNAGSGLWEIDYWFYSYMEEGIHFIEFISCEDNAGNKDNLYYNPENTNLLISVLYPSSDADLDGIPNDWENSYSLDPFNATDSIMDYENDNITNIDEYLYRLDPTTNDTDSDNLSDYDELFYYFTNPRVSDSDGDGVEDGLEIEHGTDPNDPLDFPILVSEFSLISWIIPFLFMSITLLLIISKRK